MSDEGLDALRARLHEFARDWEQFHPPKNPSMALAGEVGELLEVAHAKLERNRDRFPPPQVSGRADVPPVGS